jgi:hypothetical protein
MRVYPAVMGARWEGLPAVIRRAHSSGGTLHGTFEIRHGPTRLARVLARLLRCPRQGAAVPVTLRIDPDGPVERWHREFGPRKVSTTQWAAAPGLLDERIGPLALRFRLDADRGELGFEQVGARACLGGATAAWPHWCRPHVRATEAADGDGLRVSVQVSLPRIGLLLSYTGRLDVPAS